MPKGLARGLGLNLLSVLFVYKPVSKNDKFDKSEITRTTTTIKSFLRPLPQYMFTVKNQIAYDDQLNI